MSNASKGTTRILIAAMSMPAMVSWSGLAAADAETASSGGGLEEIVVTAQKRSEKSVDVPISLASVSADALAASGINSTFGLTQAVPGLRLDMSGAYVQPTIRGVGSALAGPGMNSNVAIYIDGFYQANLLGSDLDMASIQSVDVLKGPQGTLFGRNATGGAILVTTKDPSHEFGGELKATYGSFNRTGLSGYITGGFTDTLAADLTAYYETGDGYIKDMNTHASDAASFNKQSVRGKLQWTPSDAAKFTLTLEHRRYDDPTANYASNYDGLSIGNIFPGLPIASGPYDYTGAGKAGHIYTGDAGMLRMDFDVGFGTLTSYSMYRDEKGEEAKDYDGVVIPIFNAQWQVDDTTYTQELNLASKPGGAWSWVTGLFYYHNTNKYPFFMEAFFGGPAFNGFKSDITQESIAAFGDVTWEVVDNLFITAGLRYGRDKSDASYLDLVNPLNTRAKDDSWDGVTPRFVVRYGLTDNSNIYASYTGGYKAGIVPIQETTESVDPEKIDAFEIGYKYAGNSLLFDAAAFYYDYKDLQIASYIGQTSLTRNAAASTIYGVDMNLTAHFADYYTARLGAAYTHAEYDKFPGAVDYVQVTDPESPAYGIFVNPSVDASGNTMQRTPEFTGTLALGYDRPLSWGDVALDANAYYTTKYYFDPVNRFKDDGYTMVNAQAAWTDPTGGFTLALYAHNVLDEAYRIEVLPGPFAIQQAYGEPRAYGVQATFRF